MTKDVKKTEFERLREFRYNLLVKSLRKKVPAEIERYISTQDLQAIYNSFGCNVKLYSAIKPGETKRFKKNTKDNLTNRTVSVMRNAEGEYHLILETKSKLASNAKDKDTPVMGGAFKYGKFSWRIDTDPPQKWISLRTNDPDVHAEKHLMDELRHPNVDSIYVGAEYEPKSNKHIDRNKLKQKQVFAPAAIGSLDKVVGQYTLSEKDKNDIMLDILTGLQYIHSKGYAHQDIKPDNILIYRNSKTGKYSAKVSDFGLTGKLDGARPLATLDYASPEVFAANLSGVAPDKYFLTNYPAYGKDIYNSSKKELMKRLVSDKNDSWAVGILAYRLFHANGKREEVNGDKIQLLSNKQPINDLIKGLLAVNQEQRLSCNQAMVEMQQIIINAEKSAAEIFSPVSDAPSAGSSNALTQEAELPESKFDFTMVESHSSSNGSDNRGSLLFSSVEGSGSFSIKNQEEADETIKHGNGEFGVDLDATPKVKASDEENNHKAKRNPSFDDIY